MRYLPTGEWMQRADTFTIDEIGIPSMVLMERAALACVNALEEYTDPSRTLIICGGGNNGGDGFAAARLLHQKGYYAEVLFVGTEVSMSGDCAQQKKIAEKSGVPIVTTFQSQEYTTIVDAIFGVGLNREITGAYFEMINKMNQMSGKKAAIDIPSGICSATGAVLGTAFRADITITFAAEKLGCVLYPGHSYAGKVIIADIGISKHIFEKEPDVCYTFETQDLPALIPARHPNSHKGTYGKILMITGTKGMAGASYLSAKAAYAMGGGLVRIYTAEENSNVLQQLLPEAIISTYTEYDEEELEWLLTWADVVCLGCGLGKSKTAEKIVLKVMNIVSVPCVIDADGLNLLSCHPELLKQKEQPIVLTPHMKEMAGLLGCSIEELQEQRMEKLKNFTHKYGVVCALKDARTLVSKWDRQMFVNTAGNSAMAKAGCGDVLAGVITGLLASKLEPYEAAVCGVYVHACGGDEAKEKKGSYSVLAEDLIEGIGNCMKKTEENMKQ